MLDLQEITNRVIKDCGEEVLRRAESMKPSEVTERGRVEFFDGGFVVKYDGDMSAYYEFSTGVFAKTYLADKPQEVKDEAMKFYKNGRGTLQSKPYLYPAMLWALDEIPKRIKLEVNNVWNNLKF